MAKTELEKVTMNLRRGDFEFLQDHFPKIGAGPLVRKMVSNYVDGLRKRFEVENAQVLKSTSD